MKSHKKNRFLGIDESMLGKEPEIYVAVFSDKIEAVTVEEELPKRRGNGDVSTASNGIDYRFVLVDRESIGKYGLNFVRGAIFSVFIIYYTSLYGELERVIIDGMVNHVEIDDVRKILHPIPVPLITAEPKADSRYPIVNSADHIANQLGRYYINNDKYRTEKNKNRHKDYRDEQKSFEELMLELPLEEYMLKVLGFNNS